ncbi:MAG: segregation and condensation protein, partial [Actinomycetota bacterium]|nr:segregation and condensation protein [Actinomycetota bacterium]
LLPGSTEDVLEDDLALYEERDLLLARLLECKTFSGAGSALGRMIDAGARSSPRTAGPGPQFLALAPDLLAGVTPADLHAALERAATPKPVPRVDLFHVAPLRISVADAVDELWAMLPSAGTTTFRAITEGVPAGLEVVVRFLAILEMYKQGLIELEQATTFGELSIVWLGEEEAVRVGVDSYGD